MDNTVGRLQFLFPQYQFDVILGTLLGDGRLECRSKGIRVFPLTARLRVHQGEKQKDYVFWRYRIFRNFVLRRPRKIMAGYDKKRNHYHYSWYFHTKTSEDFGLFHEYFYKDGIKIIPNDVFQFITPRAIAVWFMDDGSNTQKSFTLNTQCFSLQEQEMFIKFFKKFYNISASIIKDRKQTKIRIGRNDFEKFIKIIQPFIIPSMLYKIANPRNDFSSIELKKDGGD